MVCDRTVIAIVTSSGKEIRVNHERRTVWGFKKNAGGLVAW